MIVDPIGPAAMMPVGAGSAAAPAAAPGFGVHLDQALSQVNGAVQSSDDALVALASGSEVDLHGAMIAMQEADIALRAMVSVRDRAIGAYEQLMNLAI
jgi:flagellar hook-basal body complex protein FliE